MKARRIFYAAIKHIDIKLRFTASYLCRTMYYLVYGLLYLFSLLPLRILYLFSDFACFLIYHVIGYRKKVVFSNLKQAFPGKSEKERKKIAKKFYRNFTDTFIEAIKMISVSDRFIEKRIHADWEYVNKFHDTGRSVQFLLGHNFNWEWANRVAAKRFKYLFLVVYMPLTSKVMDRLFYNLRAKSGSKLLPATKMQEAMMPYRNQQYLLALVADQNPGVPLKAWWFNFLGKPAPFVTGPEKGARNNNTIVIFVFIHKLRRGHYQLVFKLAEEEPNSLPEKELTRRFVRYLEDVIREYPDMWLWSHRRWKHDWKPEYGEIIE